MCSAQVRHLVQEHQAAAVLMAYGISAAGKTYTIEGTRSEPGVLPRALDLLFQVCNRLCLVLLLHPLCLVHAPLLNDCKTPGLKVCQMSGTWSCNNSYGLTVPCSNLLKRLARTGIGVPAYSGVFTHIACRSSGDSL